MEEIKSCKCVNAFQDAQYGKGMRVHNKGTKGHSCTVCGSMKAGQSGGKK
jgi:hypothetical protein